ncbi:MAG: zf-HC2 domain-containing protein [Spirochaetia bacterium]|nr:zf-HC2 domain-containing protein [Spirochaetia bacterium]
MDHKEAYKKLDAFLDNEIAPALKAGADAHIKNCVECSAELEKLVKQGVYLKAAGEVQVPPNFRAKITEALEAKKAGNGILSIWKLIPIPAAMTFLILVFSAYMVVAPVAYGMNNEKMKSHTQEMTANALAACFTGSVFAPAAFAEFCSACTQNVCTCCEEGENICGKTAK